MSEAQPLRAGESIVDRDHRVVRLLVAATLGLWGHYGTAVFYEMILAGIACASRSVDDGYPCQ